MAAGTMPSTRWCINHSERTKRKKWTYQIQTCTKVFRPGIEVKHFLEKSVTIARPSDWAIVLESRHSLIHAIQNCVRIAQITENHFEWVHEVV
jgi:hypothetical protein